VWVQLRQRQNSIKELNLQEFNRFGYRVGFPGGFWREIFNSDFYDQFPNPAQPETTAASPRKSCPGTACRHPRKSRFQRMASSCSAGESLITGGASEAACRISGIVMLPGRDY